MGVKAKAKTIRAAVYARISRDPRGESVSPARQDHECRALIEQRGWTHVRTFTDRDVSAFKDGVRRPAFEEMLDAARRGDFDVVVATSISRLARSTVRFHQLLEELCAVGVQVVTVHDPVDTSTPQGRLITSVISSLAQMESELVSERLRASHQVKAARGDWVQGPRTFGYTAQGEVIEEEADLLREAAERVVGGATVRATARWLNERGARTTRGNEWSAQSLGYTLTNPRIAGLRRGTDGELVRGTWEPLVDETTFGRLVASVSDVTKPRGDREPSLLSGIAVCALCGSRLYPATAGRRGQNVRVYACQRRRGSEACGGVAVTRDNLDAYVARVLTQDMAETIAAASPRSRVAALEVELAELEERLSELARLRFSEGQLTPAEWRSAREALVERVEQTEGALAVARSADVGTDDLASWWDGADFDERASLVRHMIAEVRVSKATRRGRYFDPARVSIRWRWAPLIRAAEGVDLDDPEAEAEYLAANSAAV